MLALLGLYPQYRAVRSIWLGWVASPDWSRYDEVNRRFIYIIEPVVESMLQLFCQSIILYIFIGPGEGGVDNLNCKVLQTKWGASELGTNLSFQLNQLTSLPWHTMRL